MKTFETVLDILENALAFHRFAENLYQTLSEKNNDERVSMLLCYMRDYANELACELEKFTRRISPADSKTWVQITLEESPEEFFAKLGIKDEMTVEDVNRLGQQIEQYLTDLFGELVAIAATESLRDIFQNLMDMEVMIKRRLSQATNSILREM